MSKKTKPENSPANIQPQPQPQPPLDLNKYLTNLQNQLSNMKRNEARSLGEVIQQMSEGIGRNFDQVIQLINPLVNEVGRLQRFNEELKALVKQVPDKNLPSTMDSANK